jgi:hypothetical protein
MPPFMAPKPASPFPVQGVPTPTAGPTIASAPPAITAQRPSPAAGEQLTQVQSPPRPFPGVASGVPTPPSVAQKLTDAAAPAATPSFLGSAPAAARTLPATPGTQTFMRKSVIDRGVSASPGATVRPAGELNVGGASVVMPGSVANAPNPSAPAMPTSNTQGFLNNLAAATNAVAGVDRRADAFVRNDPAAMARRESFLSKTSPFGYNPSEKSKIERARNQAAQEGFMRSMVNAKLEGARGIEEVKGKAMVGAETARGNALVEAAKNTPARGGRVTVTPLRQTDGSEIPYVIDAEGNEIPPPPPSRAAKFLSDRRRTGAWSDWNKYTGSDAKVLAEAEKMREAEAQSMAAGASPQQRFDDIVRKAQESGQPLSEDELQELRRRVGL